MSMSTKLFTEQALNRFDSIAKEVQKRQAQVATGRRINEAADAPMDAVKVSVGEQRLREVTQYQANIALANQRLSLTDVALESGSNLMVRLKELAISAASDTVSASDRKAIAIEVEQIKEAMLGIANAQDARGQALFGGLSAKDSAFVVNDQGIVEYDGDTGARTIAISGTQRVSQGLHGAEVFQQIETSQGTISVFDAIDSFLQSMQARDDFAVKYTNEAGSMSVGFKGQAEPQLWKMTITGPRGTADIAVEMVNGHVGVAVDAINDVLGLTGVRATASDDQQYLQLTSDGPITLSQVDIGGVSTAGDPPAYYMEITSNEGVQKLASANQTIGAQLGLIDQATESLGFSRAKVGAQINQLDEMSGILERRELVLTEDVSKLRDADLEKIITELQSLLVNQDAARQVYSTVSQRSLFDFLS